MITQFSITFVIFSNKFSDLSLSLSLKSFYIDHVNWKCLRVSELEFIFYS